MGENLPQKHIEAKTQKETIQDFTIHFQARLRLGRVSRELKKISEFVAPLPG